MRILITTDSAGGVWDHTLTLATTLLAQGHEPIIAHTGPPPRRTQRLEAKRAGLPLHTGRFPLEWQPDGLDQTETCRRWLQHLADERDVDVVHCNSYNHVDPTQHRPQLLAAHSTLHGWWQAVHDTDPPSVWEPYRDTVRAAIDAADVVVAPSHAMLAELRRFYGPTAGRVVHNGIAGPWGADSAIGKREKRVFTSGRLWDKGKGHHVLDAAAAGAPWPVYAAGALAGPEGTARFRTLRSLGFLPRDELERQHLRAGLYANPALYEPFGLGALEAAARGCPLLLSDLPTHRELWRGAARFVTPGDADGWRDALATFADDTEWQEALSEAAWHHARRYNHRAMAAGYLAAYSAATQSSLERLPLPLAEVPT